MIICPVCGEARTPNLIVAGSEIRSEVAALVKAEHQDWDASQDLCLHCLDKYRAAFVENVLERDKGELSQIEVQVMESLRRQEVMASNLNRRFDRSLTLGERLADKVAEFGGSWGFIGLFALIIAIWMTVNKLQGHPFDPYPFILLNLVLSCVAALQAPVIMMSQNRQEDRDRMQAEDDYRTNLKAELEIRQLHDKMDHLLLRQMRRLMEVQELQIEMLQEISGKRP